MRRLVKFARCGALCMVSHLDLMRCVQRTLRRAHVPMAYSQGFNPHPLLSFGQALGVGLATRGDFEITLEQAMPPASAGGGVQRACARRPARPVCPGDGAERKEPHGARRGRTVLPVRQRSGKQPQVDRALTALFACKVYPYLKKTKKGEREDDLRKKLFTCAVDAHGAHAVTACGNEESAAGGIGQSGVRYRRCKRTRCVASAKN